jgi:hypothetical protein
MLSASGVPFISDLSLRWLARALAALLPLVAAGCVPVAARVPEKTKDTAGKPAQLDFTFLKSGSTTRDEVTKKLAMIDSGVNQNDFFWGRWKRSVWGRALVGPVPPEAGRNWGMYNLLIHFDQYGVVERWVMVDDKGLDQQLDLIEQGTTDLPLDLSSPLRATDHIDEFNHFENPKDDPFHDMHTPGDLVLTSEHLEYDDAYYADRRNYHFRFETARANIWKIASTPGALDVSSIYSFFLRSRFLDYVSSPRLLVATIYFSKPVVYHYGEKRRSTFKKRWLVIDPPTFLLLRRYIRQTTHDAAS